MNRDQIIAMAREAGYWKPSENYPEFPEYMVRFAALVAAAEREECAKVCDELEWDASKYAAREIRARGTK